MSLPVRPMISSENRFFHSVHDACSQASWPAAVLNARKQLSSTAPGQKYVGAKPKARLRSPRNQRERSIRCEPWIDQFAAAGDFGVEAPLLLVAEAAAMAVAAANEQERTDRALVDQRLGARDRRMEAVIESDLGDDAAPPRRLGDRTHLLGPPAGFSTSTWRPASTAASAIAARLSWVVAITAASMSAAIASRQSATARADVACERGRAGPRRCRRPRRSRAPWPRRRALCADQAAADDGKAHYRLPQSLPRSLGTMRRSV